MNRLHIAMHFRDIPEKLRNITLLYFDGISKKIRQLNNWHALETLHALCQ